MASFYVIHIKKSKTYVIYVTETTNNETYPMPSLDWLFTIIYITEKEKQPPPHMNNKKITV